ncbi:MAG: hypothetical protein ACYCSF_04785 [Acidimicrobiales bacterium]
MPYGTSPLLRHVLGRASPWQRYLIGAAMVAGGVVLVLIGHLAGGLLSVSGILLLFSAQARAAGAGSEGERP